MTWLRSIRDALVTLALDPICGLIARGGDVLEAAQDVGDGDE